MLVFPHSCLPLTANLLLDSRRSLGNSVGQDEKQKFLELVNLLISAVRKGSPPRETISWTYEYSSLWSPSLRDTKGRRVNVWRCSAETFIGLVSSRTHWYKRLPKSGRNRLKKLAQTSKGRRFLKDCLDTADGVQMSTLFSFPEMYQSEGYALSDRITNSVIMNCFHSYSSFQKKLKDVRKTVKHAFLNQIPLVLSGNDLRSMSYWAIPCSLFNRMRTRTSKEWIFRLAMFSQTRATGLAGTKQCKESLDKLIENSQREDLFQPNELLLECIETVTDYVASQVSLGPNPEFRISMSTSACRESKRKDEGKFGYLKTIVRERGIKIPSLMEDASGVLGNPLWRESFRRLRTEKDRVMSVNVTVVRENGKGRGVTSGSFWKETALQPFSHMTIQCIKTISNLKDGLRAAKLGWESINKIVWTEYDKDGFNWIFDNKNKVYVYTTDWSEATDGSFPKGGRAVTGRLLEKLGVTGRTLENILEYWLGKKLLYVNGQYQGRLTRGIPMGDPLTKTNLSLSHPICDLYAKRKTQCKSEECGNGDDTRSFCSKKEYADAHLECAELLGYKKSPLDEALTECWGTYCEEWFYKPTSKINTCKWANRFKNSLLMPYLDVPKLRVVIATSKDREDFSSDPRGKISLMGHEEEYFSETDPGPSKFIFGVASACQDVCLASIDRKEPLFLPRQINGVGKAPPYWSKQSWLNIMRRCTPWHKKYYLTVMREFNTGTPGVSSIRGSIRSSQHFADEAIVETYQIPQSVGLSEHIEVTATNWSKYPDGVLEKLIGLGYLVRETKLAKYYLMHKRLSSLEQDLEDQDMFECIKSEMKKYPDIDDEDLVKDTISTFVDTFKDQPYRLSRLRQENLYSESALKFLDNQSPLAVTDQKFPFLEKFGKRIKPQSRYEADGLALWEWFKGFQWAVLNDKTEQWNPPHFILDDDPLLLQEIDHSTKDLNILVTEDVKLYKLALKRFPARNIARLSVPHFLQMWRYQSDNGLFDREEQIAIFRLLGRQIQEFTHEDVLLDETMQSRFDSQLESHLRKVFHPRITIQVHRDFGSIESWENKFNEDDTGGFYQTIGIPWTKDIKSRNLEKKPNTGFYSERPSRDFSDFILPRSIMMEVQYRQLWNYMCGVDNSVDIRD